MGSDGQHAGTGEAMTDPVATASTMRAIVQHRYGSVDELKLARVARPEVAENEVLVRVHAAGLDRGTWHLMAGPSFATGLLRVLPRGRRIFIRVGNQTVHQIRGKPLGSHSPDW